ncbi:MAG: hypothetical protein ACYC25_03165 [Paludibacter sp.]
MDNLRSTINLLFNHQSIQSILESFRGGPNDMLDRNIPENWFCDMFGHEYNNYNHDQHRAIYEILKTKWLKQDNDFQTSFNFKSCFNVLSHFTQKVLSESDNEPICKYEHFLRWHELSARIGEDLLSTSFLALNDILRNNSRLNFNWRPVITHDNNTILKIFDERISELHFHLKGSSLNFDLNWLSLMNNVSRRKQDFKILSRQLVPSVHTTLVQPNNNLHEQSVKAAAIRALLVNKLKSGTTNLFEEATFDNVLSASGNEILIYDQDIQRKIDYLKSSIGRRYKSDVVDYAICQRILPFEEESNESYLNSVLSGERWFMYSMFKEIYAGNPEYSALSILFYFYIAVKSKIRQELIQVNKRIGFGNFSHYERRKEIFMRDDSVYERLISNLAINATFNNQKIQYLEARITPKSNSKSITDSILLVDRHIKDKAFIIKSSKPLKSKDKYYYIFHYIKTPEKYFNGSLDLKPKNWKKRSEVKKQTIGIYSARNRNPKIGNRIVAIDAANSEFGCRPEVFAQAYRFLKNSRIINRFEYIKHYPLQNLGYTYHVGEDFYDLVDGMRAIDEAILFLNLKIGDRLGHALVLGVDSSVYYTKKNKTILMPKQDFLDNVVWLLVVIKKFGVEVPEKLIFKLKGWYEQYFRYIFQEARPTTHTYYQSWLLRGDNPNLYTLPENEPRNESFWWNKYALNKFNNDIDLARVNIDARKLYYRYHFDSTVKERGSESDEYIICNDYIEMVSKLQQKMLFMLAKEHLAIETNLTSNKLIGDFQLYENHPITKFFNSGLELNAEKLNSCPQINVSINTDDQGIFATSVEKEFSLMALSLIKKKDNQGNSVYSPDRVYEWLGKVRRNAEIQKFKR